jgi:hypothetical protein
MALTDSLDELITSGAITPQLAMKVLSQVCLNVGSWDSGGLLRDVVRQEYGRYSGKSGQDKDHSQGTQPNVLPPALLNIHLLDNHSSYHLVSPNPPTSCITFSDVIPRSFLGPPRHLQLM